MGRRSRTLGSVIALGLVATGLSFSSAPSQASPDLSERCDGIDDGRAAIERTHDGGAAFAVLPDVNLPSKVEAHLRVVADRYHKVTGKGLVVTSGTRDAAAQAEVIYQKLAASDDIVKLYKAKAAAQELKDIYDDGRAHKTDKSAIVDEMAAAIRAQIKKGVYISAHLRAGAADVRSTDMSSTEKRVFVEASETGGLSVMLESTPPHFHLQLE